MTEPYPVYGMHRVDGYFLLRLQRLATDRMAAWIVLFNKDQVNRINMWVNAKDSPRVLSRPQTLKSSPSIRHENTINRLT